MTKDPYASLRQGLVGAWCPSVSGPSGYRAVDLSGYGNHGTLLNGATWAISGGNSLSFDGLDDAVVIPNSPWLNNQSGAISTWVKFAGNGSGGARSPLVSLGETSAPAVVVCALRKQDTKNVFQYRIINSATSVNNEVDGSTVISNGIWYHVAIISSGLAYSLFVNGAEESLTLATGANNGDWIGDLNLSTTTQRFGSQFFQSSLFSASNAQLDDIRIYNRALTPSEIKLLASKRGIGLQPRPRHYTYYQFPAGAKRRRILTGMP